MKFTVLVLAALIGVVAWLTHEPVRDELSGPIEVLAGVAVGVAEASSGPAGDLQAPSESRRVDSPGE